MHYLFRWLRGTCPGGQHYYVKKNGSWTCTMCGATK